MAGAPVTMQSVLQFLTKYATPAKAISAKVQQYQSEVPMRLRCFGPASSVRSTNVDIDAPPAKKSRRVRLTWFKFRSFFSSSLGNQLFQSSLNIIEVVVVFRTVLDRWIC